MPDEVAEQMRVQAKKSRDLCAKNRGSGAEVVELPRMRSWDVYFETGSVMLVRARTWTEALVIAEQAVMKLTGCSLSANGAEEIDSMLDETFYPEATHDC